MPLPSMLSSISIQRVLVTCLVASLAACAGVYSPPKLPPGEVATLLPPQKHWGDMVFIDKVDGMFPSQASAMQVKLYSAPLALAPGKHRITVRVRLGLGEGIMDAWLVAEAGKTYRIMKKSVGYKFTVWFVDDATGLPAGGFAGSDDEPQ